MPRRRKRKRTCVLGALDVLSVPSSKSHLLDCSWSPFVDPFHVKCDQNSKATSNKALLSLWGSKQKQSTEALAQSRKGREASAPRSPAHSGLKIQE